MKERFIRHESELAASAILTGLVLSMGFAGWRGLVGMAAGFAGTSLHLWVLWRIIEVLGDAIRQQPVVRQGTTILLLGFVIQFPAFYLVGIGISRLGPGALPCFVAGLTMVYFAAVGWAISRT